MNDCLMEKSREGKKFDEDRTKIKIHLHLYCLNFRMPMTITFIKLMLVYMNCFLVFSIIPRNMLVYATVFRTGEISVRLGQCSNISQLLDEFSIFFRWEVCGKDICHLL